MNTKEERIEYMQARLKICEDNYNRCKKYADEKVIESERIEQCKYLNHLVEYWKSEIEKEQQREGN